MTGTTTTIGVMIATLGVFIGVGFYYGRANLDGVEDFLSARGSTNVSLGLATFVAYAAGSGLLFSPPEAGARLGIAAVIGYGVAIATPFLLYLTVAPKIRERMPTGHSVVEYARVRYGEGMAALVLVVALFYMFILMTANLTGVAVALRAIAGVPLWVTLVLVGGAVMVYTVQGGLLASIFTDLVQTVVLVPLLVVTVAVAVVELGGPAALHAQLEAGAPQLMRLDNPAGVRFAVYIVIALIGAEMLNQSLWQRAHAARDAATLRRTLAGAAVAVVPMTVLAGLYGVIAAGLELGFDSPAAALPAVVQSTFGPVMQLAFVVLVLLVIASTLDNALSAIVSILAVDIYPRVRPSLSGDRLLRAARVTTFLIAVVGVGVALTEPSVLFLLLRADLLASATVVPVLVGLYTPRLGGRGALLGALGGIAGGVPFFLAGNYLYSFTTAIAVSAVVCGVWMLLRPADYSFERLREIESFE
ncbi:MAG: sodium:proline symporter [Haloferacaceae archaeon]